MEVAFVGLVFLESVYPRFRIVLAMMDVSGYLRNLSRHDVVVKIFGNGVKIT